MLATPDTIPDVPCTSANRRLVETGKGKAQGLGNQVALIAGEPTPLKLLPTPVVNDMGVGKTPDEWEAWNTGPSMAHQPHGPSLAIEVQRLLPTPTAGMVENNRTSPNSGGPTLGQAVKLLPTPDAYAGTRGGSQHPDKRRAGGHSVSTADVLEHLPLLPTPKATNNDNAQREDMTPNLGMELTRLAGVPPKKRGKGKPRSGESTPTP